MIQPIKKHFISKVFIVFFSVLALVYTLGGNQPSAVKAETHAGFTSDIVTIKTAYDLENIDDVKNNGKTFLLNNDIDLGGFNWTPLDTSLMSGTLDGGGYSIINLTVDYGDKYIGLFSKNGLNIKNLFIKEAKVSGAPYAAILAGQNSGKLSNVHVFGAVTSSIYTGGLVAENYGDVVNCSFDGSVTGRTSGGLIAVNSAELVSNSYSRGTVSGQKIGGFVSTAYNTAETTARYTDCFSFSLLTPIDYDETVKRAGGFIASREEGILIEDCFADDVYPGVGYGDFNGVRELGLIKRQNKASFEGFDFKNYWYWDEDSKHLSQRTIAVSSNKINMADIEVTVKGDRAYYCLGETATLRIFADGKENLGVLGAFINGNELSFTDGAYTCEAIEQINVNFTAQYLLHVQLNKAVKYGTLKQAKQYYAPGEPVLFEVVPDTGSSVKLIHAVYNGVQLTFKHLENGFYLLNMPKTISEYADNSVLFIDVQFSAPFDWSILLFVAGAALMLEIFILMRMPRKKQFGRLFKQVDRVLFTMESCKRFIMIALKSIITLAAVGALVMWFLLITDIVVLPNAQLVLIIMFPLISAVCVVALWFMSNKGKTTSAHNKKKDV